MYMDDCELDLSDVDKLLANDDAFHHEVREGTRALPGSDRKIEILMVRYASGIAMHQPGDRVPTHNESVYEDKDNAPFPWVIEDSDPKLSEALEEEA